MLSVEEAHDPGFSLPVQQFLDTSIGMSDINGFGFATLTAN